MDILTYGKEALALADQWSMPLLLMHGTEDRITSPEATREFSEKADGDVDLVLWEGYYHETHNDLGNEKVIEYLISWLNTQTGQDS
jgi:alpha-beta hydrolase superfamily lysophospholipase